MVNPVVDLSPEKFAELGEEGRNSELQEVISKIQRAVTAGSNGVVPLRLRLSTKNSMGNL